MTSTGPDPHGPSVGRGDGPDVLRPSPRTSLTSLMLSAPSGKIALVVAALIVVGLVVSGTVAVANGTPAWVLALAAVGSAVAGIWGGRQILRLLLPETAPASATSAIDLRPDDDRTV